MKQGWEVKKLGDAMHIARGGSPRPIKKYITDDPNGINWIKIGDASDSNKYIHKTKEKITRDGLYKSRFVEEGDFLLSNSMSFGRPYIMKTTGCIHDGWLVLKENNNTLLDKDFLYHLLCSPYIFKQFDRLASGSTVRNLNIALVSSVEIPIPPLDEQKRIVAKLDECFDAIDKAHANVEKNLNNAKELFQSQLNQIFSQNGDGWVEKKLGDVCDLSRGQNPPKKDFIYEPKEGYVRFYQIRDGWSDKYKVYVPNTTKLHRVDENEILMVAYRHIGRRFRGVVGAFNVALCKITNKDKGILEDDYLYHIIPTDYVRGELLKRSERSLIPSMSVKHLMNIEIPLPPIEEQKKIVIKITKLHIQTQSLESNYQQELEALDELKKSILQKAFNGEL